MKKYIVIDGFNGNKGGMRNLGEPAHNKEFDTLKEAIEFVKGAKWSIRTLRINPGFSRNIGRKELNPNLVEEKKMERVEKYLIANKNVLIGKFPDLETATQYIKSQDMLGDECKFEGYYFSCFEIVSKGEQGTFGVDWDSLIAFDDDYKAARKKEAARYIEQFDSNFDFADED